MEKWKRNRILFLIFCFIIGALISNIDRII